MNVPVSTLPIGEIVVDDSLQPRCDGLNEQHIATLMETPEDWPPIVVAQSQGASPVLLDGFHRVEAAARAGYESITAQVIHPEPGTDLFALAFALNLKHGRPLTLRDRKAYAAALIQHQPALTDREIGRRCALNHETVGGLRDVRPSGYDRKPGELPTDVGVLDPIRFAKKATREQKAVAGYVQRLAIALRDPYDGTLGVWSENPTTIARACLLAMGSKRATTLLTTIETDANFMLDVTEVSKRLIQEET